MTYTTQYILTQYNLYNALDLLISNKMAFKNNVLTTFSRIKVDMDLVKDSFSRVKEDMIDIREKMVEWNNYFDLRQREVIVELKELKEKVKVLEEEKLIREIY